MNFTAEESVVIQPHDPRWRLVVRIEWTLLVLRYIALGTLVVLNVLGLDEGFFPGLPLTLVCVLAHNGFAHWVLGTGRHEWFVTRTNFVIYLLDVSLIAALTGDHNSAFAVLYPHFIIGYCLYSPRFESIYDVTLVCCGAYLCTFLYRWVDQEGALSFSPVLLDMLGIFICGWLMSTLGLLLRNIEHESQRQARQLATSEATLRTIFNSTAEPILVCDENEFITEANKRACEFLGVARQQLIGKRFRALLFDDGTLPNKMSTLRTRGEFRGEVIALLKDGEERDVDLLVRSYFRDEQRFFVFMLHDITVQKNVREASRLANQRLAEANRELQQVTKMRSAFIARTSKQLRSPLSALLGYNDLLLNEDLGELTPEQRKALHSSRRTIERVLGLVDQAFEVDAPLQDDAPAITDPNASPKE